MKRLTLLLFASTVLFAVAPAHAIVLDQQLGLEAGTSLPSGDFSADANTGYNIGLVYEVALMGFGIGSEIKYNGWSASEDLNAAAETAFGPGSEIKFSNWQYGVYGTYALPIPTMVKPYARVGMGAYGANEKVESPLGGSAEGGTKFGLSAGIGADFSAPGLPVKFGMTTMYNRLKNSDQDFYSVNARVMWPLKVTP